MPEKRIRIVSFNVCGAKGILSHCASWLPERSLESMFNELKADIICFQETKLQSNDIPKDLAVVPHYNSYFTSSTVRKGYSGVAIYVKDSIRVLKAEEGLTGMLRSGPPGNIKMYRDKIDAFEPAIYPEGMSEVQGRNMDAQGRSITLDLGCCVLIGLYCPADSQGNMGDYREQFYQLLDYRVTKFRELGREVIVLGDLNVAREPRDSAPLRDELLRLKREIQPEEWKYGSVPRKAVNDWVEQYGFQDTTRKFHEDRQNMYTCWDISKNCRPANFGSRIDYILVSEKIQCVDADIMADLGGSDHCPVYADVILDVESQGLHKVPYLSRSLSDRWKSNIKSFFQLGKPRTLSEKPAASNGSVTKATVVNGSVKKVSTPKTVPKPAVDLNAKQQSQRPPQLSISQMFAQKDDNWKKRSERLGPPLCEHGEPCILKRSSVPPRKGEYFWMCGRSMGGKANRDGEHRCKTFIWDNDR